MNIDYDIAIFSRIVVALSRIKAGDDMDETLHELDIYKPMFNNLCRIVENSNINNLQHEGLVDIESDLPAPILSGDEKLFCEIVRSQDLTQIPLDISETLPKVLGALSEKEQAIIKRRYYDGWSYSEIGKDIQLTAEGVRQSERHALKKLRDPNILSYIKLGEAYYQDCKRVTLEKQVEAERKRLATMEQLTKEYRELQDKEQSLIKEHPNIELNKASNLVFTSVRELDISTRSLHSLIRANILTIFDLGTRNAYDLLQLRNLGKLGVKEIADAYDKLTGQEFDRTDFTPKHNISVETYFNRIQNR